MKCSMLFSGRNCALLFFFLSGPYCNQFEAYIEYSSETLKCMCICLYNYDKDKTCLAKQTCACVSHDAEIKSVIDKGY